MQYISCCFSTEFAPFTYKEHIPYDLTEYMTALHFYWNISDESIISLGYSKLEDIKKKD